MGNFDARHRISEVHLVGEEEYGQLSGLDVGVLETEQQIIQLLLRSFNYYFDNVIINVNVKIEELMTIMTSYHNNNCSVVWF